MEQQRQEEIEANRIEELQTGGFIPPESEIEASTFEVDVERSVAKSCIDVNC